MEFLALKKTNTYFNIIQCPIHQETYIMTKLVFVGLETLKRMFEIKLVPSLEECKVFLR